MSQNVAVVGCGYWGKNLVRNFKQIGQLGMVCDLGPAGRELAREIAPEAPFVDNLEDVLSSSVSGVVIATPAETHYELTKRAILSGKDVFVEKPLALTLADAAELVQLAEQHERILMVGHVLEYHPAILRMLELVHDDAFGKIHYIYSNRMSLGRIRREENILWSFAPHDIAVILRIMRSLPFQVIACGGSYIQPNTADVTLTHLLFDNGVRAHIHVSWLHPFKEQRLVVIGSRKMASYDDVEKQLLLYDQRVELKEGEPVPIKNAGESISFGSEEPLRKECEAFLFAIDSRNPPTTDGRTALPVLRVLGAAQRSLIMNGEAVIIPHDSMDDCRMRRSP